LLQISPEKEGICLKLTPMDERRKSPRIDKILPIKLSDTELDILTETKNISTTGAYCSVDKPLELMTKLRVVILIPFIKNKAKVIKKINCCGVVVRRELVDDTSKYPYRIAIYFTDLKEQSKKNFLSCIKSFPKN